MTSAGEGELALAEAGVAGKDGEGRSFPVEFLGAAKEFLEDANRPKAAHDLKSLILALDAHGIVPRGFEHDVMLYGFLLDGRSGRLLAGSACRAVSGPQARTRAAERAEMALALNAKLGEQVDAQELRELYRAIDLPLAPVLARMERTGIRIDPTGWRSSPRAWTRTCSG